MPDLSVVYGNWKIRFGEPLAEAERGLRLFPLPVGIDPAQHSILEDLAQLVDAAGGKHLAPDGTETPLGRAATVANLFGADIPLATVQRRDAGYRIHHRLTRLDPEGAHLIRVGDPIDAEGPLWSALWQAFDHDHLA